jgi:hypothetical protein
LNQLFRRLQSHHEKLVEINRWIEETLLADATTDEAAFTTEYEGTTRYQDEFSDAKLAVDTATMEKEVSEPGSSTSNSTNGGGRTSKYRLPKLELKKFGGDPREWLSTHITGFFRSSLPCTGCTLGPNQIKIE